MSIIEEDYSEHKKHKSRNEQFFASKEVKAFRIKMIKFANLQLGDRHLAEDAVQEALLAAYDKQSQFGQRSSFQTWVYAILKNKIKDALTKRRRETHFDDSFNLDTQSDAKHSDDDFKQLLFTKKGFWEASERPQAWSNPEQALLDKQFWAVFDLCLDNLPAQQAKFFMMREFIGLSCETICEDQSLQTSNLHVILHRARLRLQKCLEYNWFMGACDA